MDYVPPLGGAPGDPYIDANLGAGTAGSDVAAAAVEHPQREIVDAITQAGLVPSGANLTQLYAAMVAIRDAGFDNSLAANGYQEFPGGLILQWGTTPAFTAEGTVAVVFPLAFPTSALAALASADVSAEVSGGANVGAQTHALTLTGMSIFMQTLSPPTGTYSFPATWLAIGH